MPGLCRIKDKVMTGVIYNHSRFVLYYRKLCIFKLEYSAELAKLFGGK